MEKLLGVLTCSLRLQRHLPGDVLHSEDKKHRNLAIQGNCTLALLYAPSLDQITSENTQFESFTLSLATPSVYFALNGLLGALLIK